MDRSLDRKVILSPNAARELLISICDDEMDFEEKFDAMGQTDCPNGCHVEPDGHCSHNYQSAGITANLI